VRRGDVARRVLQWLGVMALAAAAPLATAQVHRHTPFLLRIEGFVGEKPEGITSLARWIMAVNGKQYQFHVTKLQPIGVDVAYWNILSNLEPLPVTLTLYGNPPLLRRFKKTPAGERIALVGVFQSGPGPVTLLLRTVESLGTPAPS
jgi:hypothetical protein